MKAVEETSSRDHRFIEGKMQSFCLWSGV